jgi:chromatin structure-remodeling complex subunit RSC1/2
VDVEAEVDVVDRDDSVTGTRGGVAGSEVMAGGEAEGAGVGMGMERDSESDEIVRALEKGLPRWEGLEDVGWMADIGHVSIDLMHPYSRY